MNSPGNDPIRNLPLVIKARDGNRRAATWQVVMTAFALIAIVTVLLWGINNQRDETAGQQTAATMPAAATPQGADAAQGQRRQQAGQQAPSTTGQGAGGQSNDRNERPQTNGQKTNARPVDSNGEPAQRQSKPQSK